MVRSMCAAACAAVAIALSSAAEAHITLERQTAEAGATYKAVLRVPHGCAGSPMVRLRVRIPDGVLNVKPQPKPGWTISSVTEKLANPMTLEHGRQITEVVRELAWSGGKLPDDYYDEFVFRAQLPDTPGRTLYFPAIQECEHGVERWIEIPKPGENRNDYEHPAPELILQPKPQR
ncbi:MAG: YcnI family protein [Gemmatimonas sp.]